MKLKSIPPKKPDPVYRASLHKTGKIGLTIETANRFGFSVDISIELLINEEDKDDKSIYGILRPAGADNAYRIMKGGDYHSINAASFFDSLKIDYRNANTYYSVSEIEVEGDKVLKFSIIKQEAQPGTIKIPVERYTF